MILPLLEVTVEKDGTYYPCTNHYRVGFICGRCNSGILGKGLINEGETCPNCFAKVSKVVINTDMPTLQPGSNEALTPKQALLIEQCINKPGPWTSKEFEYISQYVGREITPNTLNTISKLEASTLIDQLLKEKQAMNTLKTYTIRVQSPFLLTPTQVKTKLGVGYKVLELEVEKESNEEKITSVDSAVEAIVRTGFRALARAFHPDLGGDAEVMTILNRAKKELKDLLQEVRG